MTPEALTHLSDPPRDSLALARLLRLASPALPVGAYSYSQGLETAIGRGWLRGDTDIDRWIGDVLTFNLTRFEGALFCRLHRAWEADAVVQVMHLNRRLLAARETAELRAETIQMGYSLRALFRSTGEFAERELSRLEQIDTPAFAAVFTFACAQWNIPLRDALTGYWFAWAENQVNAAMKIMQLGHVGAQRILARVGSDLPDLVDSAASCGDDELSNFAPALVIASCLHEGQYSRLFRS